MTTTPSAPAAAAGTASVIAPEQSAAQNPPQKRRIRGSTFDDWASLAGAAVASFALVTVLYEHVLHLSGTLGYLLCWYVVYLLFHAGLVGFTNPRTVVVDRLIASVLWGAAGVVVFALGSTVIYTLVRGWSGLVHTNFFTKTMAGVGTTAPLTQGGALHAIVGTGIEVGTAVVVSVPLGFATAVYMSEVGGRFVRPVRTVVEAMTALPEILAGLFVYVTLIVGLGLPKSGLAASIAMSVTMVPIIARAAEVTLRLVPASLREAGAALGSSHWQTVWRIVLPTAKAGLATSVILGVARGIGETAVVLITSGSSGFLIVDPLHNQMNSLPLYIYTAFKTGEPVQISRGFAAASVLLLIVLLLFGVIRVLTRGGTGGRGTN